MSATQKNITETIPAISLDSPVCARYLKYPDLTGKRQREGGLRLKGKYKASLANKPLVSIITVVYNFAHKLERAINSVLNQTYDNIEYIIVDGGSTDGTLAVIQKFKDSIDYYVSEPDRGIYHAMNKGLELATGDYIALLNSSDWYTSDAVEVSINGIISSGADYSGANTNMVDEEGIFLKKIEVEYSNFNELAILTIPKCFHGTMFISNMSYNAVGQYDEKYEILADIKTHLALIKQSFRPSIIHKAILNFETGGASGNWPMWMNEFSQLFKEFNPDFTTDEEGCLLTKLIFDYPWVKDMEFLIRKFLSSNYYSPAQKKYLKQKVCFKNFEFYKDIVDENIIKQVYKRPALIWGTGNGGKYTYKWLSNMNFKVTGFIDTDSSKWDKTFLNLPIYSPQTINIRNITSDIPYIFIGTMYVEEVKEELAKLGYEKGRDFCIGKLVDN